MHDEIRDRVCDRLHLIVLFRLVASHVLVLLGCMSTEFTALLSGILQQPDIHLKCAVGLRW
jgi:hypothetical protein